VRFEVLRFCFGLFLNLLFVSFIFVLISASLIMRMCRNQTIIFLFNSKLNILGQSKRKEEVSTSGNALQSNFRPQKSLIAYDSLGPTTLYFRCTTVWVSERGLV
jgi:hypothetical protein